MEGPRLGDLSVAASSYGGVIPVGFGTQKVAGTIIWATDIREEKHTNTQGGALFGGGTKVVEYRYFASFAVALGEGPAGAVTRIWAGDKLIARLRSSDHAKANHPKYRFRIYLGSEDQQPDPLIRKHVPANAAPAHRGLVYLVFEDLPLDEFGNRVPPITAEVAWAGAADAVANTRCDQQRLPARPLHHRSDAQPRLRAHGQHRRPGAPQPEHHDRGVPAADHRDLPGLPRPSQCGRDRSRRQPVHVRHRNLQPHLEDRRRQPGVDWPKRPPGTNGDTLEILSIYDLSGATDWVLWVRFLSAEHAPLPGGRPEPLLDGARPALSSVRAAPSPVARTSVGPRHS